MHRQTDGLRAAVLTPPPPSLTQGETEARGRLSKTVPSLPSPFFFSLGGGGGSVALHPTASKENYRQDKIPRSY